MKLDDEPRTAEILEAIETRERREPLPLVLTRPDDPQSTPRAPLPPEAPVPDEHAESLRILREFLPKLREWVRRHDAETFAVLQARRQRP
jgi:hypothetical protein